MNQQIESFGGMNIQVSRKDILPMFIGFCMLLLAGYTGYLIGVESSSPASVAQNSDAENGSVHKSRHDNGIDENIIFIPDDWSTYDSIFFSKKFSVRYPARYILNDTDTNTGQMFLFPQDRPVFPSTLSIGTFKTTFYFQDYQSGSVQEWFLENLRIIYPDTDFTLLQIDDVDIGGKKFIRVSNWSENLRNINPNLFSGTWFVGESADTWFFVAYNDGLSNEDLNRIVYSIGISSP